ncbi:putative ribosome-binding factor A, mitochondrial isoform X2 [Lissotriton helveticus]
MPASFPSLEFQKEDPADEVRFQDQMHKPPAFLGSLKTAQPKKEDGIRMRALNVIVYKTVVDLLDTGEICKEAHDLRLEVTRVALAGDFSACRVYWKTSGDAAADEHTETILQKTAPRIRHWLITHQVIGGVPPVVFVKDRENAALAKIEQLLEIADYGPRVTEDLVLSQSDLSGNHSTSLDLSPKLTNVFGIDHGELNKQIVEYKQRSQQRAMQPASSGLEEQLAELRKQKILRRKKKERKNLIYDDDITPPTFLMDRYSEDDLDIVSSSENRLEDLEELESQELDFPPNTGNSTVTKA